MRMRTVPVEPSWTLAGIDDTKSTSTGEAGSVVAGLLFVGVVEPLEPVPPVPPVVVVPPHGSRRTGGAGRTR